MQDIWNDVVSALFSSGHINADFVRQTISALISSILIVGVGALIVDRFRDIAQFGRERYKFASELLKAHRGLFEIVMDPPTNYRRALPQIIDQLRAELGAATKLIDAHVGDGEFLTANHFHLLTSYRESLDAFSRSLPPIGAAGNWNPDRTNKFNESSEALAPLVKSLVSGRIGKALREKATAMKVRGNNESVNSIPADVLTPSLLLAAYRSSQRPF